MMIAGRDYATRIITTGRKRPSAGSVVTTVLKRPLGTPKKSGAAGQKKPGKGRL